MKKLLAVMALGMGLSTPAWADFVVTGGSTAPLPVSGNAFNGDLSALGFDTANYGGSLSVNPGDTVVFYALGSESQFYDSFLQGGNPLFSETDPDVTTLYDSLTPIGSATYVTGSITDLLFHVDNDIGSGDGLDAAIGSNGFAIIFNSASPGGLVAFGFDDNGFGPDDNHDDLVILARIVPEPATWGLMIAGFGMLGWMTRRRRVAA